MTEMDVDVFGLILGTILIYFLPGFPWTFLIIDEQSQKLERSLHAIMIAIERVVLSIGLSLVFVPLTTFILNAFIKIGSSILDSLLISLVPMSIGFIFYYLKRNGYLKFSLLFTRRDKKS